MYNFAKREPGIDRMIHLKALKYVWFFFNVKSKMTYWNKWYTIIYRNKGYFLST